MKIARAWIAVGLVVVLGAVNYAILAKERIKRDGVVLYLDLAPVDPRSLMQGDYMALRFRLAEEITRGVTPKPDEGTFGHAGVMLDAQRVAHLAKAGETPNLKIRYRMRNGAVWLGTNAFFFEERTADRYTVARYGEFRVDVESGEAVLVRLADDKLKPL